MALLRFSSIAANVSMDPRIGPIQGVQPKAKAAPTISGKVKFWLFWLLKTLMSWFINLKLITPISWSEKNIIIILAIILKISELSNKKFPRKDAVRPKLMNTREKPKLKKTVFINTKLFFFSINFSNDEPEI